MVVKRDYGTVKLETCVVFEKLGIIKVEGLAETLFFRGKSLLICLHRVTCLET